MAKTSKQTPDSAASPDAGLASPVTDDELAAVQQAEAEEKKAKSAQVKAAKEQVARKAGEEQAAQETVAAEVAGGYTVHCFALKQPRKIGDGNYLSGDIVGQLRLAPGVSPNFFVSALADGLLREVQDEAGG